MFASIRNRNQLTISYMSEFLKIHEGVNNLGQQLKNDISWYSD